MRQPARVLWLVDSLAADAGTERQIIHLGSRLSSDKFQLQVATFEASPRDAAIRQQVDLLNFPIQRLLSPSGLIQLMRIALYIRRNRIQIVQGFMFKGSVAAAMVGILSGAPVVLTSRRNLGYYYTRRILRIVRILNSRVTRVVANSQAAKMVAVEQEAIPPGKVDVLHNGVDMREFETPGTDEGAVAIPAGKRVVGMLANYRAVKDIPLFLRAAALVARQIPDAVFLLAGSGSLQPELEQLARELGIADRVIFTGGHGEVPWYLHQMHVGCLSSESEGFSNSILEYMAAGLPVVATNVGGNAEAIVDGVTGFLAADRTPESFAAPILRLLREEPLRQELGHNGRETCRTRFGLSAAVMELERYYLALLRTGAPPPLSAQEPSSARERRAAVAG